MKLDMGAFNAITAKMGITRDDEFVLYAPEKQIEHLGLKESDLEGKRILDVGCGEEAEFVEHCLDLGYNIEGIDPNLKTYLQDRSNLMCQEITGVHPGPGHIPRPNNSYDVIIAHTNTTLNAFLGVTETRDGHTEEYEEHLKLAGVVLTECLRVMSPRGKMFVWPGLDRLTKYKKSIMPGIKFRDRLLQIGNVKGIKNLQDPHARRIVQSMANSATGVTIIQHKTKKKR